MANGDFELTIVISAIDDASAVLQTVASEIVQFDDSLIALQQDTLATLQGLDQLTTVLGSATDLSGGGGSVGGFDFLSNDTNPLYGDFSGLSSQQPDLMGQMVGATQSAPSSVQLIQNNTFNGILDPSAIQDQVIPELERAVARGATLLATA